MVCFSLQNKHIIQPSAHLGVTALGNTVTVGIEGPTAYVPSLPNFHLGVEVDGLDLVDVLGVLFGLHVMGG